MRVLIFGASGMLGHKLYQCLGRSMQAYGTIRSGTPDTSCRAILDTSNLITNVDVADASAVEAAIERVSPDVVLNAVGIIKQLPQSQDVISSLSINSIFPQQLARLSARYGFRLITISTDCVFDGKRGNYAESDIPDARDLYGLSKLLGEVSSPNCLTIRTSIIGRELGTGHSIVEWFLSRRGSSVKGFRQAIYTGFPTVVLADIIKDLIERQPQLEGVWHVSSDPISKLELLQLMNAAYGAGVSIEPSDDVIIDRSLDSSRFRKATGFVPEPWPSMVERLESDPTPYQ